MKKIVLLPFIFLFVGMFCSYSQTRINVKVDLNTCYLGVMENKMNNSLNIFPNPTSGLLNILFEGEKNTKEFNIIIYNIFGQIVFNEKSGSTDGIYERTFDISYIPNGVYLVRITNQKYNTVKKIIKN